MSCRSVSCTCATLITVILIALGIATLITQGEINPYTQHTATIVGVSLFFDTITTCTGGYSVHCDAIPCVYRYWYIQWATNHSVYATPDNSECIEYWGSEADYDTAYIQATLNTTVSCWSLIYDPNTCDIHVKADIATDVTHILIAIVVFGIIDAILLACVVYDVLNERHKRFLEARQRVAAAQVQELSYPAP